jgi:hypothetical protein
MAPVCGPIAAFAASISPKGTVSKHSWAETVEVFGIAGRGDRRERAAVKSSGKSDDAELFRVSARSVVFARRLNRAFDGFRSGIGEKYVVGETNLDEAPGQAFGLRDLEEIGGMPDFRALLMQRLEKMRMAMAERRHGDAAAEIKKPLALRRSQPGAIAPLEGEVDPGISGKQRRDHDFTP